MLAEFGGVSLTQPPLLIDKRNIEHQKHLLQCHQGYVDAGNYLRQQVVSRLRDSGKVCSENNPDGRVCFVGYEIIKFLEEQNSQKDKEGDKSPRPLTYYIDSETMETEKLMELFVNSMNQTKGDPVIYVSFRGWRHWQKSEQYPIFKPKSLDVENPWDFMKVYSEEYTNTANVLEEVVTV